jgi:predicted metal-dependent phosphoesterase TrpH
MAGVPRFLDAAQSAGIRAVSGVEVSADVEKGALHILGYGVRHDDLQFNRALTWILEGRDERNKEILSNLARAGIPITMEEVKSYAGSEVVGRPHFAAALIHRGYVRNKREAFSRFLARGRIGYAERKRMSAEMACELIRSAGGVPSIAHPFSLELGNDDLFDFCAYLKDCGLLGLECYYPEHTPSMVREYVSIADELGLIPTGGSDFHGAATPDLKIGRGFGRLNISYEIFDRIAAAMVRS